MLVDQCKIMNLPKIHGFRNNWFERFSNTHFWFLTGAAFGNFRLFSFSGTGLTTTVSFGFGISCFATTGGSTFGGSGLAMAVSLTTGAVVCLIIFTGCSFLLLLQLIFFFSRRWF